MQAKRRLVCLTTVATALLASGCGFRLRGSGGSAALPFSTVFIADGSSLTVELKRYIASSGTTKIVTDPLQAEAIIEILRDSREKQILTLNAQGRVREYTLLYRVAVAVKDNKNVQILNPTEIVLRRILSYDEAQALAKEAEEATLYRDMQSDMVGQIIRRVAAIPRKPMQSTPATLPSPSGSTVAPGAQSTPSIAPAAPSTPSAQPATPATPAR